MLTIDRRAFFTGIAAAAIVTGLPGRARAVSSDWAHGMSIFGDLKYGPDFTHFDYANPDAPKGGFFGTDMFGTFNSFNPYILQGDPVIGMGLTFDSLMTRATDEPDALYGLVAQSVSRSEDGLTYRFRLRPEARFNDGSPITPEDVAFSIMILKEEGHPSLRQQMRMVEGAEAEDEETVVVRFVEGRSRDLPLSVAGLPIFSAAYWEGRNFGASTTEPPLGSGPYRVGRFESGRFVSYERVEDYWAADLPVNRGQNNFDRVRYDYFRDRQVAFEAFRSGAFNYREEFTSRDWATGYNFPALNEGRVVQEELIDETPSGRQGWWFNTRREKFADPRIREALGYLFDFESVNRTIMFDSYMRTKSYFENSPMAAEGPLPDDEAALLEPFRDILPERAFGDAISPPVSDGSGTDRTNLRRAQELLQEAGCTYAGRNLMLPNGERFTIEFLDFSSALEPHTLHYTRNLGRIGIDATLRVVDASQFQRRVDDFDFDVITRRFVGSLTPGGELRVIFGSEAAETNGSPNIAGIADPAVDALVEKVIAAETREEMYVAARALDRVLRAGFYWVPMWFKGTHWLAFWDEFGRPETKPRFSVGALSTWWIDEDRARAARRT